MIEIEKLKNYAGKLMFDMKEEEYETLQKEFDVIIKQMELIENIDGIENVEPMTFPVEIKLETLRDDSIVRNVENNLILKNAKDTEGREVSVPRVVE